MRQSSPYRSHGFTLIELLVVLFLLGLIYALAGSMLNPGVTSVDIKAASRQLAAGLRKARSMAIADSREVVLTVQVDTRQFSVGDDPRVYALPKQVDLALFTAQSELVRGNAGNIRFFADGSSTGGRITVSSGQAKQVVDVDWLTGRAKIL